MARKRYDSGWKEVEDINGHVLLCVYLTFVFRGLGILVVTWSTVVLLGGFVSMIDKQDFWNLTMITFVQILWIDDSFRERVIYARDLCFSSVKMVNDLFTRNSSLSEPAGDHPKLTVVEQLIVVVGWVLSLVHNVVFCLCIIGAMLFLICGLAITAWISIHGLMEQDHYGDKDDRTNMDPAHNLMYALCVAQLVLYLYRMMLSVSDKRLVKQVSQAYGFQDDGHTLSGYMDDIRLGCSKNPYFARERNLITYAVELMESNSPLSGGRLTGTLILDRLLTRQHSDKIRVANSIEQEEEIQQQQSDLGGREPLIRREKKNKGGSKKRQQHQQRERQIIGQQRRMIKQLIGSATSTDILQKLLQTLDSRHPSDRKMREPAARIVEHVAGRIRLDQFPQMIQCISSLINTFEEYGRIQEHNASSLDLESESESESDSGSDVGQPSSSNALDSYKELVLTGLRIIWSLAASEDNCATISDTKHLVSKIMAPVSYNLLHRTQHSAWSTMVVERSLGVMLRLIVTTKGDTGAGLRQQMSNSEGAITTMKEIVDCAECRRGELQMKAMQILTQLCMDESANRGNLTKLLVSMFVNGDICNGSIRKTAGETLVLLFLSSKSVTTLLPTQEHGEFISDLAKILVQVGDNDTSRKNAAQILEHLCVHYTKNGGGYFSTLKNTITGLIPEVLREICHGSTGEVGKPEYARSDTDVESQSKTKKKKERNKKKNTSSSPGQNQQHKLHVALLSLCVTACEKLELDLDAISMGEGRDQATDPGESVTFSLGMKMVQLNRDLITPDSLTAMKLTTKMVIEAIKKLEGNGTSVDRANLESLIDSLSSVSETMLDLEGCMVFAMTKSATVDTLNCLVKQARQLHAEIKDQNSEIVPLVKQARQLHPEIKDQDSEIVPAS